MTQLLLASTTIGRHANEVVQWNSIGMFIKYGASRFTHEGGINTTQTSDVGYDFILTLDNYQERTGIEYLSEHEDSMEVQIKKLIHASTKKMKDMKWSYGGKNQQLLLELEHLQGIILYEQECAEHRIDPLKFEAHNQEWEKNNVGLLFA